MLRKFVAPFAVVLAALLAWAGTITSVEAASNTWTYYSTSGGTRANLIGSLVTTDLTGASNIGGVITDDHSENAVASVSVPGLISVGAVTSSQDTDPFEDGVQVTSKAKVAGINLLGGAIKVDAVEVTNVARASSSGFSGQMDSKLLNLTIGGESLPLTVSPNTKITIPGLAEVVINKQTLAKGATGIQTRVTALYVTLLKDVAGGKIGSTIELTPSNIFIVKAPGDSDAIAVGGFAYGSAVKVNALNASVNVPPTALLMIPSVGTGGVPATNSTLTVNVPGVIQVGAIETKVNGTSGVGVSDATAENQIARVNVLNGLITADAVNVKSHVHKGAPGSVSEQSTEVLNLRIAGQLIPINPKPNTQIFLLGIGTVYINQQLSVPGYSAVVGVRLIVSGKGLGLPVGADVQLGVASTYTAA